MKKGLKRKKKTKKNPSVERKKREKMKRGVLRLEQFFLQISCFFFHVIEERGVQLKKGFEMKKREVFNGFWNDLVFEEKLIKNLCLLTQNNELNCSSIFE